MEHTGGLKTIRSIGGNMETKAPNGIKVLCVEDEHFISELDSFVVVAQAVFLLFLEE